MELTPLRQSQEPLLDQADVQSLADMGIVDPPPEPDIVELPEDSPVED